MYSDNPVLFNIKDCLEIVNKKYNNHIHSTTKYTPNHIFYSNNEELFKEVLKNIKKSFKYIGKEFSNFKINEKCLLNKEFKIKKRVIVKIHEYYYMIKLKIKNITVK